MDDESERNGGGLYEITVRSFNEPDHAPGKNVATWAVPVSNERVLGICEVSMNLETIS